MQAKSMYFVGRVRMNTISNNDMALICGYVLKQSQKAMHGGCI